MCSCRQHEAPIEGHDPLSRTKDEDLDTAMEIPNRIFLGDVWAATAKRRFRRDKLPAPVSGVGNY